MHWLFQGLRKVQGEPGVIKATQNFKRKLLLILLKLKLLLINREGKKIWHLWFVSSCLLRERGKTSETCSLFSPLGRTPSLPACYSLRRILLTAFRKSMALPTPLFWNSSLQTCERINYYKNDLLSVIISHFICATLLWQPWEMNMSLCSDFL